MLRRELHWLVGRIAEQIIEEFGERARQPNTAASSQESDLPDHGYGNVEQCLLPLARREMVRVGPSPRRLALRSSSKPATIPGEEKHHAHERSGAFRRCKPAHPPT